VQSHTHPNAHSESDTNRYAYADGDSNTNAYADPVHGEMCTDATAPTDTGASAIGQAKVIR